MPELSSNSGANAEGMEKSRPAPGVVRSRPVRLAVLAVGVLAAALITVFALSDRGRGSPPVPVYAPEFAGETLDGGRFNMAEQRGRWVVVNFFSTWCVQCVVEHPELVAFHDRYRDNPEVRLVSVVFQDDAEAIAGFFAERGGDWPVVMTGTGQIAIDFGVTAVPETYLVAPGGRVASKFTGGVTLHGLEAEISRLGAGA